MFDTLVCYGIPIILGVGLAVAAVIARLLGRSHDVRSIAPRPPRPAEDADDVGGDFTCFFCDMSYDFGAEECICYGCNRYICLNCTDYEESQTPGGPDGLHTAIDHPARVFKIRREE